MPQHIAGAVDPGTLAVPHGEHAIVLRVAEQIELLAAPDGGGGEVLVDPRLEMDVAFLEELAGLPHGKVDTTQRRAAIAGHKATGIKPGRHIAMALHHRQAHQRLGSGDEDPAAFQRVFVVEGDGV